MGVVYILRALPGAGKSTLANIILDRSRNAQEQAAAVSADYYFYDADNNYNFDIKKIGAAHEECRKQFSQHLSDKLDTIVVDNTNTTESEIVFYRQEAEKANYFVQIITVGEFSNEAVDRYTEQNTHKVPRETILKMRNRFKLI